MVPELVMWYSRVMARPSKYKPEMNELILDEMREGASLTEIAALISVNRETIRDWCNPKSPRYKEEFSGTIKRGVEFSEGWWLRQGRINLRNKKFNYTLWFVNMKNRFGWSSNGQTRKVRHKFAKESVFDAIEAKQREAFNSLFYSTR